MQMQENAKRAQGLKNQSNSLEGRFRVGGGAFCLENIIRKGNLALKYHKMHLKPQIQESVVQTLHKVYLYVVLDCQRPPV